MVVSKAVMLVVVTVDLMAELMVGVLAVQTGEN